METTHVEAFAGPMVHADRTRAMADLKEAILDLKGDAVGLGRLRTGFFVEDLVRLCRRFLDRRAKEVLVAYDSALSVADRKPQVPAEAVLGAMRRELLIDAEEIERELRESLLPDHLRIEAPLTEALEGGQDWMLAQGQVLLEWHARCDSAPPTPGSSPSASADIVELRPNLWGIGINLRALWPRLRVWLGGWRGRQDLGG